jgi:hypothetical protein
MFTAGYSLGFWLFNPSTLTSRNFAITMDKIATTHAHTADAIFNNRHIQRSFFEFIQTNVRSKGAIAC